MRLRLEPPFEPPPAWSPLLLWLAGLSLLAHAAWFLLGTRSGPQPSYLRDLLLAFAIALAGFYAILEPERIHRFAPYWHGGLAVGVRIFGLLLVGFSLVLTLLLGLALVLG